MLYMSFLCAFFWAVTNSGEVEVVILLICVINF